HFHDMPPGDSGADFGLRLPHTPAQRRLLAFERIMQQPLWRVNNSRRNSLLSFFQIGPFDYGQFSHLLISIRRDVGNDLDVVQSLDHLAENCVLAVPGWIGTKADEELAIRAVRVACAGHTDRAARERARAEFSGHFRLIRISSSPQRPVPASASLRTTA